MEGDWASHPDRISTQLIQSQTYLDMNLVVGGIWSVDISSWNKSSTPQLESGYITIIPHHSSILMFVKMDPTAKSRVSMEQNPSICPLLREVRSCERINNLLFKCVKLPKFAVPDFGKRQTMP
eukprot:scaffold308728_cov44-Attheya_sp.AAC.1